jgi:hypothetical protein
MSMADFVMAAWAPATRQKIAAAIRYGKSRTGDMK